MSLKQKSHATILLTLLFVLVTKVHIASAASNCITSSATAWPSNSFATQSAQFAASYNVTPSLNGMDGAVGFSLNAATGYTGLAVITRFSTAGVIDVRNGAAYSANLSVPYTAGLTYHFRLLINPATKTYTVYVTPPGGTELTLATNYAFRSDQATTSSLNNWTLFSDTGSLTVCNMFTGAAPSISSQPASQTVTAGGPATFTVTAAGTAPLAYQWQKNGVNIAGATSASYTTPATTASDSGATFRVLVTNPGGTVTSNTAILTVNTAAVCLTSSPAAWSNSSFPTQTAQFSASYDVTPNLNNMDVVLGFSLNAATGYTSLAAITRFSTAGVIDARNGAGYAADVAVPYTAGLTYHFRILINPANKTYTVYVTPAGGTELALASNYAFRSDQAATSSLNNWGMYANLGSLTVCNMTIGTGSTITAPSISTQPASQKVTAGQTATFTVTAAGTAPLTYQWQKNSTNIAGATSASYTTPVTTTTDNGSTFRVLVNNTAGTAASSAATLTVNPAPAPGIQLSSSSINFGSEAVGGLLSQVLIITNPGTATLTISRCTESGSAFSLTGYTMPINVAAGQQATVTVAFQPTVAGAASGSISIVSNAAGSPTSVALSGTGVAATLTLGLSPASLSFGNVTTGTSSSSQTVTVTNTGNANVTISQLSLSGSAFSMTGGNAPVTLTPSQTITLAVQFSPKTVGSATGNISIVSTASGSPATVSLSGTGVAPIQHSVSLNWNASSSAVSGYNVYRSTVSGGPYTKMNSSLIGGLTSTDSTVQSAIKYYYVTTAVDSSGLESAYSNEVPATIP